MKYLNTIAFYLFIALTLYYFFTGLYLFLSPKAFFDSLPFYYGSYNIHFVKDAGLSFIACGLALILSVIYRKFRLPFTLSGIAFILFHALFHLQMMLSGMTPQGYFYFEFVQVLLPASFLILVSVPYVKSRYGFKSNTDRALKTNS